MVAYSLPLQSGATKIWSSPTETFTCCHGTMVQAHSSYCGSVFFEDDDGLVLSQYIPSELRFVKNGVSIRVSQNFSNQYRTCSRSESMNIEIDVESEFPIEFAMKLRVPWWIKGDVHLEINAVKENASFTASSYYEIKRIWHRDKIRLTLPRTLYTCALPDNPNVVAFMDGPGVLVGLCAQERVLTGDIDNPNTILTLDNEREWGRWKGGYRTKNQDFGFRLIPLHEICDEKYQVYFQIKKPRN